MDTGIVMVLGLLGIYFLAPFVLAIVAMVQVKNLRRKVEDLERFSARRDPRLSEQPREVAAPPAPPFAPVPSSPPPPMPVEPEEVALIPVQPRILRAATEVKPEPAPAEHVPLENVIGERILPRIGVVTIVLGLALLVWYSYTHLGPHGRLALAGVTGAIMVAGGVVLRRHAHTLLLGGCLIGGGWAVLYITAYAAHFVEASRIFERPLTGFLLLLAVSELALIHALRFRNEAIAALAYLLTVVSLFLSPASGPESWIAIGVSGAVVIALVWKFRWIRLCALGAVLLYAAEAWWLSKAPPGGTLVPTLGILVGLWLLWILPDYFLRPATDWERRFHGLLVAVNFLGAVMIGALIHQWFDLVYMGWVWFSLGALYSLHAIAGRNSAWRLAHQASLASGAILLAVGFHHLLAGLGPVFAWFGLSAALFGWGLWRKDEVARLMGMAALVATAVRLWLGEWRLEHGWIPGVLIPAGLYAASAAIAALRRKGQAGRVETTVTVALSHIAALSLALVLWNHPPELMSAMLFAIVGLGLVSIGPRLGARELGAEGVCYLALAALFVVFENLGATGEFMGMSRRVASMLPVLAAWLAARAVLPKTEPEGENLGRFFGVLLFAGVLSLLRFELGSAPAPAAWAVACAAWYLWSRWAKRDFEFKVAAVGSAATVLAFSAVSHYQLPFLGTAGAVPTGALILGIFTAIHAAGGRREAGKWMFARDTIAVSMAVAGFLLLDRAMDGTWLTGSWAVLGFALAGYGFLMRDRVSRWSSLAILGICVGKVVFFDLANFEMPVRIATLLTLGTVMVALSWVYARHHRRIRGYLAGSDS